MPTLPPDYLDNTDRKYLATHLNRLILEWEQRELDIATGFFDPAVWRDVGESFLALTRLRLLLGKTPEVEGLGDDRIDLARYYREQVQGEVEAMPFNREQAALIDGLLAFLCRESVDVRIYPSFLHAKAYLFSRVAIVGSSNFTRAGLYRKAELNMLRMEQAVAQSLRREWFDPFWAEAHPYKEELIATLEASKFGSTQYSPFQVFIKALYEFFKDRLLDATPEAFIGVNLASFQQEGLREAIRLLDRHHGVMVADAVGLGKTYIGMGLLEHYLLRKRRRGYIPRGLVICPAQLRELVWNPKLDEYGIKATVRSMEEMGREDFDWRAYNNYDFVLVDESHNFRKVGTGRYQNLIKLISTGKRDKKVVLMTATPINNSIWDLYSQVMLLSRGSDVYYREYGIANLRGFFQRVGDASAELFDLLELCAVRRSRHDIKKRQEAGESITLPGKGEVRFPDRRLAVIEYSLEATYQGFYEEIAAQIEQLSLVSYNVEQYRRGKDEQVVERNNALIGIVKTTFLKRLESSLSAFEVSVQRQQRFQTRFFDLLQQGRLLDSPSHRRILALEDEVAPSENVDDIIDSLPTVTASNYDLDAIRESVQQDLDIFAELQAWIDLIREGSGGMAGQDAKLAAIKAELAGSLKGQKVLVFTYYHDTARFLYESLRTDADWQTDAGSPRLELITGATSGPERARIVRHFAPNANTADTDEGWAERKQLLLAEVQLLISTDVLSEGQNLQDAGVLINYDLHWNPVRMIQRAGRIDRLGTNFPLLTIYNCFPDAGLEKLLGLVGRLQRRIADIDRTVGLDASVLGEIVTPKSLEDLRRIKAQDRAILDEYERASELVSTDEMKLPLVYYLQSIGEQQVKGLPLGIHSGKRAALAGTFLAFRARDRHFWRFYPAGGGEVITDKRRIFQLISCRQDEKRIVPEHSIYDLLGQATQEIMRELKSLQGAQRIRPRMTGANQRFYDALNQPSLFEDLPEELRKRVSDVLISTSLVPFRRDRKLKEIENIFKQSGNSQALAEQLDAFFVENELYRDAVEPSVLEQIHEEDLQLVCYEVLT
ncbi:MAG: helicase [Chloroflexi bacterium]|nr:helicase [Chloroflexota bacterium]